MHYNVTQETNTLEETVKQNPTRSSISSQPVPNCSCATDHTFVDWECSTQVRSHTFLGTRTELSPIPQLEQESTLTLVLYKLLRLLFKSHEKNHVNRSVEVAWRCTHVSLVMRPL